MNPKIFVEYIAKTDSLNKGVSDLAANGSKTQKVVSKAFLPAVAALGAVSVFAGKAIDAASSLNEQMSASQVVFGNHAKEVQDWSKTGAKAFGLSATEALGAANAYGNMFSAVGLGADATASMSKEMVQLAGDMASFHDQDPSDMLDKLRSGLSGEAEPLRKFGILMSDATINQFAYQHGIAKTGEKLTEAQKVQARYGFIMEATTKAQGDFVKTGDSVANAQRTAAAQTENLSAQFGTALLPVTQLLLGVLTKVMGFFGRYPGVLKVVVAAVAALAAAIVLLNIALTVMAVVTAPISLTFLAVAAAVVALIAVGILLWKNWDKISAALQVAWAGIVNAFHSAVDQLRAAWQSVTSFVMGVVRTFLSWLKSNWQTIVAILTGPVGIAVLLIARYWDDIVSGAKAGVAAVKSAWDSLKSWLAGIVNTISGYLGRISSAFSGIGDAAHAAVDSVKSAINGMISWLRGKVDDVAGAASRIASAVKSPINSFISAWNGIVLRVPTITIPTLDTKIPGVGKIGGGHVGGQSFPFPNIPTLARGGVLERPTLFVGGEAGREIVTPEDLLRDIVGEGGGDTFVLNLTTRTADAADLAYGFRRLELLRTGH